MHLYTPVNGENEKKNQKWKKSEQRSAAFWINAFNPFTYQFSAFSWNIAYLKKEQEYVCISDDFGGYRGQQHKVVSTTGHLMHIKKWWHFYHAVTSIIWHCWPSSMEQSNYALPLVPTVTSPSSVIIVWSFVIFF